METEKIAAASRDWIKKEGHHILEEYCDLLRLPNHAADLPNIERNCTFISQMFAKRGFDMQLLRLEGAPPIVYGERLIPGATRTFCIYAHYDGQPVVPENWTHLPFEPTLYDGAMPTGGRPIPFPTPGEEIDDEWRLYARSASDDKAPIISLAAALDALEAAGIGLTSNIKLFFDGEEETGSPHVEAYLRTFDHLLNDITVWLLVDGAVYATGDPTFKFGSRGRTAVQLTAYGPARPLHSGHYGNWAPVPGQILARLLASMKDDDGAVLIDGFYDSVIPMSDFERAQAEQAPNIDELLKEELALHTTEGGGESLNLRIQLPSLTIRGLASGSVGEKARNVIPTTAIAELEMRLVNGNDPDAMLDLVEAHIKKEGWHVVYDEPSLATRRSHKKVIKFIRDLEGFPASKVAMDHPEIQAVINGLKAFTGDNGVFLPATGASNRIYGLIFNDIGKPGICISTVNRDNNQHAADENVRIGNLWYGADILSVLLALS
ncbi:MAG: acetylornithine deacetylase/succinyl-diaminopimelate desuccinylase-like protein [Cellvibrionaceae bacterium]|jgi:acetylornithine deacetylase/succinyl-diaminopimelate desuccinylase-like protein